MASNVAAGAAHVHVIMSARRASVAHVYAVCFYASLLVAAVLLRLSAVSVGALAGTRSWRLDLQLYMRDSILCEPQRLLDWQWLTVPWDRAPSIQMAYCAVCRTAAAAVVWCMVLSDANVHTASVVFAVRRCVIDCRTRISIRRCDRSGLKLMWQLNCVSYTVTNGLYCSIQLYISNFCR
jgi:hypothetical protein